MSGWTDDNGAFGKALAGKSEKKGKTALEAIKELKDRINQLESEDENKKSEIKNLRELNLVQIRKNEKQSDILNMKRREIISMASQLKTANCDLAEAKKVNKRKSKELEACLVECKYLKSEKEALKSENSTKVFCSDLMQTRKQVEEFFVAQENNTKKEFASMLVASRNLVELTKERSISKDKAEIIEVLKKALDKKVCTFPCYFASVLRKTNNIEGQEKKQKYKEGQKGEKGKQKWKERRRSSMEMCNIA